MASRVLARLEEGRKDAEASTILEEVRRLKEKAERLAKKAEDEGDIRAALVAIRELRELVELLSRVAVQHTPPGWESVKRAIGEALREYPDARRAVVGALQEVASED